MPDGSVYVGLRERKAGHEGCHVTNQLSQVAFHLEAKSTMLAFTPIDFFFLHVISLLGLRISF